MSWQELITPKAMANARILVYRFASRTGMLHEADELLGVAHEALVAASKRYDPSRGASFLNYAWLCMRHELAKAIRHHNRHVLRQLDEAHALALMSESPMDQHELVEFDDLCTAIDSRLRSMPPEHAAAVRYCTRECGSSVLAERVGMTRHGIECRRNRGRETLKKDNRIKDYLHT